jgi:hypothetical protein
MVLRHDTAPLIADGEIVAFQGDITSFSRLQERMQNARPSAAQVAAVPVVFYLFDLMWFDGYDLSALPLLARKSVLRRAIVFGDTIRFSEHLDEEGEVAFRAACEKGWEGLIAKRASAPYTHGRSKDWLKFKCVNEQEFVVLGWTDPHGSRSGLGALLVGYYEDGDLRYAGKVGTGFDTYARSLSRYMGKYIPGNPSIIVENMPGAGSLIAANHIFHAAKPDGLTIGHFIGGRQVEVFGSDGRAAADDRTRVRLSAQVVARRDGRVETGTDTRGGHAGWELLEDDPEGVAANAAERALTLLDAVDAPTGRLPVVVGNGFGGVLLHEAVGHGLEARPEERIAGDEHDGLCHGRTFPLAARLVRILPA